MKKLLILLFLLGSYSVEAQMGSLEIIGDQRLKGLVTRHKHIVRNQPNNDGYRIQIFFDSGASSKARATGVLNSFNSRYSDIKAYLSFKEPYYRVRVGDFPTQEEANAYLRKIRGDYPNAFTIREIINPSILE